MRRSTMASTVISTIRIALLVAVSLFFCDKRLRAAQLSSSNKWLFCRYVVGNGGNPLSWDLTFLHLLFYVFNTFLRTKQIKIFQHQGGGVLAISHPPTLVFLSAEKFARARRSCSFQSPVAPNYPKRRRLESGQLGLGLRWSVRACSLQHGSCGTKNTPESDSRQAKNSKNVSFRFSFCC